MDIIEELKKAAPVFSFEFFLPKAPEDVEAFLDNVRELKALDPTFVSLTYGAGGSAQSQTIETAGRIRKELDIVTASHLTCITHTRDEISAILDRLQAQGIKHIVALRGDKPKDRDVLPVGKRDFAYARDLVAHIKKRGGFDMAVAGYPEPHPETPDPKANMDHLKQKVDAGADWVISQLFFDNKKYFKYVHDARVAGITVPLVPGIMPVTSYPQLKRFTAMCGASIPAPMAAELEKIQKDQEAVIKFGIDYATEQCRELLEKGAPGIHFYTLNRSRSTAQILKNLKH